MIQRLKTELAGVANALKYRLAYSSNGADVANQFHQMYYDAGLLQKAWGQVSWFGVPVRKNPADLWIYQQLFFSLRPDLIIETGTLMGGSAFYFATLCDLLGNGSIVTIDIDDRETTLSREKVRPQNARPEHPRITYVRGSSTDPAIVERVRGLAAGKKTVLVVLDSDHSQRHVYNELKAYASIATVGSYIFVEDSNVNGHPVYKEHGPGPFEAIHQFLSENPGYEIDRDIHSHLMTFNPDGALKRLR